MNSEMFWSAFAACALYNIGMNLTRAVTQYSIDKKNEKINKELLDQGFKNLEKVLNESRGPIKKESPIAEA